MLSTHIARAVVFKKVRNISQKGFFEPQKKGIQANGKIIGGWNWDTGIVRPEENVMIQWAHMFLCGSWKTIRLEYKTPEQGS